MRNTEFEKNNGDFCNQYLDDMKVREKAVKKKQDSAESNRLKGKYARSMILCYQWSYSSFSSLLLSTPTTSTSSTFSSPTMSLTYPTFLPFHPPPSSPTGNRLFKRKDYTGAMDAYMEALKTLPYEGKTLLNIAQVLT